MTAPVASVQESSIIARSGLMVAEFPVQLKALTSLRFLAALWVVVFHYRAYIGLPIDGTGFIDKGYLAVDLFFILSGFILAHSYYGQIASGTYRHSAFVLNRLARIYPLHLATLLVFAIAAFVAAPIGLQIDTLKTVDFSQFPAQLFLVQSWIGDGETFNTPSWSISAEFFAYLSFPLVMLLYKRPSLMLMAGLLVTLGWYFLAHQITGKYSTNLHELRLMRIMPEFLLGAGLRAFLGVRPLPLSQSVYAVPALLFSVVVLAAAQAPDCIILLLFVGLIAALAERGRLQRQGLPEHRLAVWLGEISFALYMVHVLVGMLFFFVVEKAFGVFAPLSVEECALVAICVGCAICIAALAEQFIGTPARRLIQGRQSRGVIRV